MGFSEFEKSGAKINPDALDLLIEFVKNDLWQMENEVKNYQTIKQVAL